MAPEKKEIQLYGRVFIEGTVVTKTGLHIGGSETAVAIGGVDNTVIRDPLTGRPYIPGSSLKGKMRSLTEKHQGLRQNQRIGRDVFIHVAQDKEEYENSDVSHIYGIPANSFSLPTRLAVRDIPLTDASAAALDAARTDLPFTEIKTEVAVDRVTAAAVPRQLERVPAGAEFGPMELVFSLYDAGDAQRFSLLLDGMAFLEDDYLGGSGTRGSGKIAFTDLKVRLRASDDYRNARLIATGKDLAELLKKSDKVQAILTKTLSESS